MKIGSAEEAGVQRAASAASSIVMLSITKAQLLEASLMEVPMDSSLIFLLLGLDMAFTSLSCNHSTAQGPRTANSHYSDSNVKCHVAGFVSRTPGTLPWEYHLYS